MSVHTKQVQRKKRHKRVRSRIYGTSKCPRLCVFKSNKYTYAQLIDDEKGRTLVAANSLELVSPIKRGSKKKKLTKVETALELGKSLAQKAIKKKIKKIVFDRGGYKYHGRVKAVADGAREGGLKF